jgi:hypothetical protein
MNLETASQPKTHAKSSRRVRDLKAILKREDLTVAQRLQALALLEKIEARTRRKRAARLAAQPAQAPQIPAAPQDPEAVASCLAELDRRIVETEALERQSRQRMREYCNANPARAGEILSVIGPVEYARRTAE